MKNKYLFLCIFFPIVLFGLLRVQAQPILKRYYPLNNGQGTETVGHYNGTFWGSTDVIEDRFGNTNGAVKMTINGTLDTPSFLSDFNYKDTGFTLSFWIKNEDYVWKKTGTTPWDNSDYPVGSFFAMKNYDVTLLGMYRHRDRAVLDRYTTDTNNTIKNWGVWLWDPVNFTGIVGWYHVVISYEKSRTFVYLFYPTGKVSSCVLYFGFQDLSAATKWGLGNPGGNSFSIDDFKVYQGNATEQQAREMHSKEALPDGMYRVSLCADNNKYIHTVSNETIDYTPLEILQRYEGSDPHVYKWVFEPISDATGRYKLGQYKIRLAYEDKYLHFAGDSPGEGSRIELLAYDSGHSASYEWYVEPAGDGYFWISANSDRRKLLHTVGHSKENSARLELWLMESAYAPMYKWRLNLIKTNHEIANGPVETGKQYMTVLSDNTSIGMAPFYPFLGDKTPVWANRTNYPSLLTFWRFFRHMDDGYRIYSVTLPDYNLVPMDWNPSTGASIEAAKLNSAYTPYYDYMVEKPNKYGRRVYFKQAMNQALAVTAVGNKMGTRLSLQKDLVNNSALWALYPTDKVKDNKQVYDLKPGMYRIISAIDEKKAITTKDFSWTTTTNIVMNTASNDRYTSYYWIVDYERDNDGNPVQDGTYTIQKFGTDKLYFHPKSHALEQSAKLELYNLDRDNIETEKWFIRPTRAGDGAFYIQSAGDPTKYIHLTGRSIEENTPIELLNYNEAYTNYYRWKFQPVSIIAPFAGGEHKIAAQKNQSLFIHIKGNLISEEGPLEIHEYSSLFNDYFIWNFLKQEDNTYLIQNLATERYVHPIGHSTVNGTRLQQYVYENGYAPYYRWIITPGTAAGSYRIYSVADPTRLIHLSGHTALPNNQVEILLYAPNQANTYDWKLQ